MKELIRKVRLFQSDHRGDVLEWAIRIFVIVIVCVVGLMAVGGALNDVITAISDTLSAIIG